MIAWLRPGRTPLIVAHRGSSAAAPENTIAAFRRAVEDGADALELDIRLSSDGEIVVFHDSTLRRIARQRGYVHELPLSRLKSLSAGAWFHRKFSGEQIPTLAEVLDLFGRQIAVNIEIKSLRRQSATIVDRCCRLVKAFRLHHSILISSFNRRFVQRVKAIDPHLATGLLIHPARPFISSPARLARRVAADYVLLSGSRIRKRTVVEAHRNGIRVGEYTANSRRRIERDVRYGIDMTITNDPCRMREYLRGL